MDEIPGIFDNLPPLRKPDYDGSVYRDPETKQVIGEITDKHGWRIFLHLEADGKEWRVKGWVTEIPPTAEREKKDG